MCHFVCVAVKEEFDSQKAVCHIEGVVIVEQSGPPSGQRRQLQQPWPRPQGTVSGGLAAAGQEAVSVYTWSVCLCMYHRRGVA